MTGSTTLTVTSGVVVQVLVTPIAPTYHVGQSAQFQATAIYSDGISRGVTNQATWQSNGPAVAGVSPRALVTALAAGRATISATYQGLTGSSTVTVDSATIVSISVSPASVTKAIGQTQRFTATAIYSNGTSQDVTGVATWQSNDVTVVGVSDAAGTEGLATALAQGTATITATYQGLKGSGTFVVTGAKLVQVQITPFGPTIPVGFNTQLQATGIYSDNSTQDLTTLATWTSSAPSVASVSDAGATKGQLSPLTAGGTTVRASYGGVTGTDIAKITSATLQSIAISPQSSTLAVNQTEQLTATGTFSDGSTMTVTAYMTWLSDAGSVCAVSNARGSQGLTYGLSVGSATITAIRGSLQGTATVTVP